MYKNYIRKSGVSLMPFHKILLVMRLTTVILIASLMQVYATGFAQRITLHKVKAPLEDVLKEIRKQSSYDFFFDRNVIVKTRPVNVHVNNATLSEALKNALEGLPLTYLIKGNSVTIKEKSPLEIMAGIQSPLSDRIITGTVISKEDGLPIPGVSVVVSGTKTGTQTDVNGKFALNVKDGRNSLQFIYVGYITQTVTLTAANEISVAMMVAPNQLGEVVVTALGIKREQKSLGYSTQKLDSKDISTVKSDNFVNALSGKVAGIQVKRSSNLGGSANVVIRGNKSLTGNNQALYVIDGVPINGENNNTSTQQVGQPGFDYGNPASDINPDDIESINVLKGAAATALYGSRAANGVIMITTKDGTKSGSFSAVVNAGVTVGSIDKSTFPKYQNEYGAGYGAYYQSADKYFYLQDINGDGKLDLTAPYREDASYGGRFNPNLLVYQWDSFDPESPNYMKATPWKAADNGPITFFEKPVTFNTNVSLSGSNDKSSYRLSYTNLNQKGLMPNSKLVRNNLALNTTFKLTPKLTSTTSVNYIKTNALGRNNTGYGPNIVNTLRQWWQVNTDVQELKDIYFNTKRNVTWNPDNAIAGSKPLFTDNPYWQVYENYEQDSRERVIANTSLNYKLTDWLALMGRMSVDTYKSKEETRIAVGSQRVGEYTLKNGSFSEYNTDLMLNVNKQLTEKLNLTGVLGFNLRRTNFNTIYQKTNGGLVVPKLYALSNSKSQMVAPEQVASKMGVNGYYGSASLGYSNFLYLDLTGRSDISSTLPKGSNRYFYPSISSSFIFSEFLKEETWLSMGKLRLGYAQVGNDAPFSILYDVYSKPAAFGDVPLFAVSDTKNNGNLKPEKTKSLETGLEMSFFKSRLSLDLSLYKTKTVNQIMPVAVTEATGYTKRFVNAGEVENKGIEIAFKGTPVLTRDFQWSVSVNFASNRNKVVSLYESTKNIQLGFFNGGGVSFNAAIGEPFGVLKGKDFIYKNGERVVGPDGYYQITDGSDQVIGNMNPKWNGGIGNQFSYKGFDLSFLIDIQKGGSVFSADRWYGSSSGVYAESAGLNDLGKPLRDPVANGGGIILPGVFADGTRNNVRVQMSDSQNALSYASGKMPQAAFVYDASYVKLREVSLTYNLPKQVISKWPVKGVAISLIGSNLWIIHKNLPYADPEAGISSGNIQGYQTGVLPSTRNYGFNLRVQL